jgi:hypothetical protein
MLVSAKIHQVGSGDQNSWLNAYADGKVSLDYLKYAAAKNFEVLFKLGMFENPYTDLNKVVADRAAGTAMGIDSRKKALVLLKNEKAGASIFPLAATGEFWLTTGGGTGTQSNVALTDRSLTAAASANVADTHIFRITSRSASWGFGGTPPSWAGIQRRYVSPSFLGNDVTKINAALADGTLWRHYTASETTQFIKEWAEGDGWKAIPNRLEQATIDAMPTGTPEQQTAKTEAQATRDKWLADITAGVLPGWDTAVRKADTWTLTTRTEMFPGSGAFGLWNEVPGESNPPSAVSRLAERLVAEAGFESGMDYAGARTQSSNLFDAIKNRKDNPTQKLIVVVSTRRTWNFGEGIESYTGAQAAVNSVAGTAVRESAIVKTTTDQWLFMYGQTLFTGVDRLYIPDNVATDAPGHNPFNPATWFTDSAGTIPWTPRPQDNPIELVKKLVEGSLRVGDTVTGTGANAVVTVGRPAYVDPVAALQWCAAPGNPTDAEKAALRVLQSSAFGSPNSLTYQTYIFDPLQYIDGLIADFDITDAQLLECLFGDGGYKPSATLPMALALTDWDADNQDEDVANDEPNKLFGWRAGLVNHPATGWQSGTASDQNAEWDWRSKITYTQRLN